MKHKLLLINKLAILLLEFFAAIIAHQFENTSAIESALIEKISYTLSAREFKFREMNSVQKKIHNVNTTSYMDELEWE